MRKEPFLLPPFLEEGADTHTYTQTHMKADKQTKASPSTGKEEPMLRKATPALLVLAGLAILGLFVLFVLQGGSGQSYVAATMSPVGALELAKLPTTTASHPAPKASVRILGKANIREAPINLEDAFLQAVDAGQVEAKDAWAVQGFALRPFCSDVGRKFWFQGETGRWAGPFLVVGCWQTPDALENMVALYIDAPHAKALLGGSDKAAKVLIAVEAATETKQEK